MLGFRGFVLSLFAFVALHAGSVFAASNNAFINPAPLTAGSHAASAGTSYQAGQVLNISWTTTYSSVDLILWQQGVDSSASRLFQGKTSGSSFLWTINVDTFNTDGTNATTGVPNNAFGLVMYQTGNADGSQSFSSQYFDITGADDTGSSSVAATTTYVTALATGAAVTATATATALSNNAGVGDSSYASNDSQIRLGLGLGLGLGIPLLITVGCLAYILGRRRSRRDEQPVQQGFQMAPNNAPGYAHREPMGAQQAAFVEHYGPQGDGQQQIQRAPAQEGPSLQPIVTAKYQ